MPTVLQTITAQVGPPSVTCGDACGLDRRLRPISRMSHAGEIRAQSWTVSLGSLWRCSVTTCGLADLRVCQGVNREKP
jgi:hypothetical protein